MRVHLRLERIEFRVPKILRGLCLLRYQLVNHVSHIILAANQVADFYLRVGVGQGDGQGAIWLMTVESRPVKERERNVAMRSAAMMPAT